MTPAQAEQLERVDKALAAITAGRLPDRSDRNPEAVDLGDLLTKAEQVISAVQQQGDRVIASVDALIKQLIGVPADAIPEDKV